MFNNLKKLTKILTRKKSMQQILFHFSRIAGSIKILVSIKKLPWDKFVENYNV